MDQSNNTTLNQPTTSAVPRTGGTKKLSGAARRKLKKMRQAAGCLRQPHFSSPTLGQLGSTNQPSTSLALTASETGTQKRHWSEDSTPNGDHFKRINTATERTTETFSEVETGFRMAVAHEDLGKWLSEEETGKIQTWILGRIDSLSAGSVSPRFIDCRHREGVLLITCADQVSVGWLRSQLSRAALWELPKLRFVEEKDLSKTIAAHAFIPESREEPEKILRRIESQNPGVATGSWRVVNRKVNANGQRLIVLMNQTSWVKLGDICDHCPYVNFSRVTFQFLSQMGERRW